MARRLLIVGVALATALVVLLTVAVGIFALGPPPVAAAAPVAATLTVFTGTASVRSPAAKAALAAHSGTVVRNGDVVMTGTDSKAGLTYPDGSVTRLDSVTEVTVKVSRAGSAQRVSLQQSAGLTWNLVQRLVGKSSFDVTGPNNANASVRGTRFGYYVEHDAAGVPVIWIDTYEGVVSVASKVGPPVTAVANQRVTVRADAAPTAPVPIPVTDLQLSFTVFNQTIEAVTGVPIVFASGALSTGQSAGPFTVTADGASDLDFVLGWPGSLYQLIVTDPAGKEFAHPGSTTKPISVLVPKASAGTWTFTVNDLQSTPQEAWWVIVGRR